MLQKADRLRPSDASMVFVAYAELLLQQNQLPRARELLQEGRARLLKEAARIVDLSVRQRLLKHPTNAQLLQQAAQFVDGN